MHFGLTHFDDVDCDRLARCFDGLVWRSRWNVDHITLVQYVRGCSVNACTAHFAIGLIFRVQQCAARQLSSLTCYHEEKISVVLMHFAAATFGARRRDVRYGAVAQI